MEHININLVNELPIIVNDVLAKQQQLSLLSLNERFIIISRF